MEKTKEVETLTRIEVVIGKGCILITHIVVRVLLLIAGGSLYVPVICKNAQRSRSNGIRSVPRISRKG